MFLKSKNKIQIFIVFVELRMHGKSFTKLLTISFSLLCQHLYGFIRCGGPWELCPVPMYAVMCLCHLTDQTSRCLHPNPNRPLHSSSLSTSDSSQSWAEEKWVSLMSFFFPSFSGWDGESEWCWVINGVHVRSRVIYESLVDPRSARGMTHPLNLVSALRCPTRVCFHTGRVRFHPPWGFTQAGEQVRRRVVEGLKSGLCFWGEMGGLCTH